MNISKVCVAIDINEILKNVFSQYVNTKARYLHYSSASKVQLFFKNLDRGSFKYFFHLTRRLVYKWMKASRDWKVFVLARAENHSWFSIFRNRRLELFYQKHLRKSGVSFRTLFSQNASVQLLVYFSWLCINWYNKPQEIQMELILMIKHAELLLFCF